MDSPYPRSTFVTVLAWISIVFSGGATFIGIAQNVMIWFLFPRDQFRQALSTPEAANQTPAAFRLVFGNIEMFFLLSLLLFAFTFASSIALLRRHEWARKTFIALLAVGVLWNIGACVAQLFMFKSWDFAPAPSDLNFRTMMVVMQVFTWVFALGISALFVWIAKKLMNPEIRQEFVA